MAACAPSPRTCSAAANRRRLLSLPWNPSSPKSRSLLWPGKRFEGPHAMKALAGLFVFLLPGAASLFAQAPALFFTDLVSGPNKGGENGNGAYVTLYGNFFGSSQGASTVTAGGAAMVNCKVWGASWLWY